MENPNRIFSIKKAKKLEKSNICFFEINIKKFRQSIDHLCCPNNRKAWMKEFYSIVDNETFSTLTTENNYTYSDSFFFSVDLSKKNPTMFYFCYIPTRILEYPGKFYLEYDAKKQKYIKSTLFQPMKKMQIFKFYLKEEILDNPKLITISDNPSKTSVSSFIIKNKYTRFFPSCGLLMVLIRLKPGNLMIMVERNMIRLLFNFDIGILSPCPIFLKKKQVIINTPK